MIGNGESRVDETSFEITGEKIDKNGPIRSNGHGQNGAAHSDPETGDDKKRSLAALEPDDARHAVRLLKPLPGQVTHPLQQHAWPAPPLQPPMDGPLWSWQRYLAENDRSLPLPVEFAWEPAESLFRASGWPSLVSRGNTSLRYELEIVPAHYSSEKILRTRLPAPRAEVYNLRVGTEYLWKVTARQGREVVGESPVGQFITDPTPPRWIRVPGTTNVRDLGGWSLLDGRKIRQGLFYRGSELNSHCSINDAGRRVLIEDLGIRTDVDLRGQGEDRQAVLDHSHVEYLNVPVMAYDSIASPQ
jgi:hypothetical protein